MTFQEISTQYQDTIDAVVMCGCGLADGDAPCGCPEIDQPTETHYDEALEA